MDLEQRIKTAKVINILKNINTEEQHYSTFKYEEDYYDKELNIRSLIPIDKNGRVIKGQSIGINVIDKDSISGTFNYAGIFIPIVIREEHLQFEF